MKWIAVFVFLVIPFVSFPFPSDNVVEVIKSQTNRDEVGYQLSIFQCDDVNREALKVRVNHVFSRFGIKTTTLANDPSLPLLINVRCGNLFTFDIDIHYLRHTEGEASWRLSWHYGKFGFGGPWVVGNRTVELVEEVIADFVEIHQM